MLTSAPAACLLVVDIQERLAPKVKTPQTVIDNAAVLLKAARRLDVPVLVSEQYPRGLGSTVPPLARLLTEGEIIEKLHFSCMGDQYFAQSFRALDRSQAVVAGMESHVCVLQTVEDLLAGGTETFVVEDATSSRTERNHAAAMARLRDAGARIVTTEMIVFEWLAVAGTSAFRDLSPLIK